MTEVAIEPFKLKAILFDVDDTLIPTTVYSKRARKQALEELGDAMMAEGLRVSPKRIRRALSQVLDERGPDNKHQFENLVEKLGLPKHLHAKYASAGVMGYRYITPSLKPYPRATSTLKILGRKGYRKYGITKGDGMSQWGKIRVSTLVNLLDDSFVTSCYGFQDKSEAFYRAVLKEIGLEGKYCLMVGDNIDRDITPARKCGIHTARVLTGKYKKGNGKAEEEADYVIKKVQNILTIIPKIEKAETDKLKTAIGKIIQ